VSEARDPVPPTTIDTAPAHRVEVADGLAIALHDLGGSGRPLLILHATGFCGRMYELAAPVLGDHFHVWAVDLRGHGDSDPSPTGSYDWDEIVRDVLAVIDARGWDDLVVFGHSLGGAIALLADIARPGLVAGGVLYEPIVWPEGFRHDGPNPMAGPARRRRQVFDSRAEALARFAAKPPLSALRADALAAYVTHGLRDLADGTVALKCQGESEARTFEAEEAMTIDRLGGGTAGFRVLAGRRDPTPVAGLAVGVAEALGAELVTYERLGHFGPFQDPEQIAAEVVSHLGS
jgi:pimeloyl-ACP methyl ester carboxylesterase